MADEESIVLNGLREPEKERKLNCFYYSFPTNQGLLDFLTRFCSVIWEVWLLIVRFAQGGIRPEVQLENKFRSYLDNPLFTTTWTLLVFFVPSSCFAVNGPLETNWDRVRDVGKYRKGKFSSVVADACQCGARNLARRQKLVNRNATPRWTFAVHPLPSAHSSHMTAIDDWNR